MVGDHQRHPHRQLAAAHAPKQIEQGVVLLADKDRHRWAVIREIHPVGAVQTLSQGSSRGADRLPRQPKTLQLPFNAAQKEAGALIAVVVGVHDVAAVGGHPTGKLPHQPRLVWADHLQDGGGGRHGAGSFSCRSSTQGSGRLQIASDYRPF